jgi:hypothetical protein
MWKEESSLRRRKVAAENLTESKEGTGERALALDTNWVVRNLSAREKSMTLAWQMWIKEMFKGNLEKSNYADVWITFAIVLAIE